MGGGVPGGQRPERSEHLLSVLDSFAERHGLLSEDEILARELDYVRVLDEFGRELGHPVFDDVFTVDLRVASKPGR
ncbi:hypothetical protein AB0B45_31295 [Nonomuraea sp. NPDC049152]|uniref:hypothetical protein n=1 Tax=Nonomuraea sp. NPDC049152 TaxID=3154350 RepID=UPI0033CCF951